VRELNKKVLGIAVVLMAVAMLAVPVIAKPTKGNKVAVTLIFVERMGRTIIEDRYSNGILHRLLELTYNVELKVTDGPTLEGTAVWERMTLQNPKSMKNISREYYEFWFPIEGGGFEGHCLLMMDGFVPAPPPPATWEKSKAYGLFQGTEAFEGQTLNVGHSWEEPTGTIVWTGYWLKP
jgi:hypothetical protein